jgi:hypothetical protein
MPRWQTALLHGNFLIEGIQDPTYRKILPLLHQLQHQEANIDRYNHPIPWAAGGIPPIVWVIMAITAVVCLLLLDFLYAILGTWLVLGGSAAVGLLIAWQHDRWRRARLIEAKAARMACIEELTGILQRLLGTTQVLEGPGVKVVSAPDRVWLTVELKKLVDARKPVPDPGWQEAVDAVKLEIARIDEGLKDPCVEKLVVDRRRVLAGK